MEPELLAKVLWKPRGYEPETRYRWCSIHSMSYSTTAARLDVERPREMCPLCWREREKPKKHEKVAA